MADFRIAVEEDVFILARIRYEGWNHTYRGIYDDLMIDEFDYKWHEEKFIKVIKDNKMLLYVMEEEGEIIGYLSFGRVTTEKENSFRIRLYSLYVLPQHHRKGIGSLAFEIVRKYCNDLNKESFFLTCNSHNKKARCFYENMGGILTHEDYGHSNKAEDTCYFEFSN